MLAFFEELRRLQQLIICCGLRIFCQVIRLICVTCLWIRYHKVKLATMETQELNKGVRISPYKLSLEKQLEENARRLKEHYMRIQSQIREKEQLKKEQQKHEVTSFVCDWQ